LLITKKFDPFQEDNFGFNCYHYISSNPSNPLNEVLKLKAHNQIENEKFEEK
jgi:hypothetical protein